MDRERCLLLAKECVCGEREQDYGTPEKNFRQIAALWAAYTGHSYTPVDVAMMMALLKVARIKSGTGTEDSFVDLAGYAACGAEIAEAMKNAKDKGEFQKFTGKDKMGEPHTITVNHQITVTMETLENDDES